MADPRDLLSPIAPPAEVDPRFDLSSTIDWTGAFVRSAAESIPELIGITPSDESLAWRAEHPVAGFLSELAGMAVPYGGWLKAGRIAAKTPALASTLGRGELAAQSLEASLGLSRPFVAGAGAEALRFAPFEAARFGTSQLVGDEGPGSMAMDVGLTLGTGALVGGGLRTLGAMGRRASGRNAIAPELDLSAPAPLQLRQLNEDILPKVMADPALDPIKLEGFNSLRDDLTRAARSETASKYLGDWVQAPDGGQIKTNYLEKWFKPSVEERAVRKQRFITGQDFDAFGNPDALEATRAAAGLPEDFAQNAQYVRHVEFNSVGMMRDPEVWLDLDRQAREAAAKAETLGPEFLAKEEARIANARAKLTQTDVAAIRAKQLEETVAKTMKPVGDNWFATQETDNGLFVMARKYAGEVGKTSPNDKWVLLKTDRPGKFAAKSQAWTNAQIARVKWIVGRSEIEEAVSKPGPMQDAYKVVNTYSVEDHLNLSRATPTQGAAAKVLRKLTPESISESNATKQITELVGEKLTPTDRQLWKSARGNWLLNKGRAIQEVMESWAHRHLYGDVALPKKYASLKLLSGWDLPSVGANARKDVLQQLEAKGLLEEFAFLLRNEIGPTDAKILAKQGKLHNDTATLAEMLDRSNRRAVDDYNAVARAAGRDELRVRQGHYGFSRTWEGDHRIVLRSEEGRPIGMAAGNTPAHALAEAKKLRVRLEKDLGMPIHVDPRGFYRGQSHAIPDDIRAIVLNPGFTLERRNMRGFKWDADTPTLRELLQEDNRNMMKRANAMASMTRDSLLARDLAALSVEDAYAYGVVTKRFNQLSGVQGEFGKFQNKWADRYLAGYLGAGSASKIAQVTNEALFKLQLGFLKISHPIENMIGMIQTTMPEAAFVMSADPSRLGSAYYTMAPLMDSTGRPKGLMGFLNPLKVVGKAFGEMRRMEGDFAEAVGRGVNDRLFGQRMIEEFTGSQASALAKPRDALRSPGEFWRFVSAASDFMPAFSERFARLHAFSTGWVMARDVMKVSDPDQIYAIAKRFTERTQYLYAAADRPLVFTTPAGSALGLFKNWMMNYVASMVEYSREGALHGNWAPLLWQTMGSFAIGGAAATPLYWAANGAARLFADKNFMQWSYDEFNGPTADALTFGLPAALTGYSLSSHMSAPGSNPIRDATQLFNFAVWDRAKYVARAGGAAWDDLLSTGVNPSQDRDIRNNLIRAFAPTTLYRAMQSYQEDGTVRTLTTDLPQISGLSAMDIWMYRFGVQPTALEKQLGVAQELYASRQGMISYTKKLSNAYANAMKDGDGDAMERILRTAGAVGADVSSVLRGVIRATQNEQKDVVERLVRPRDRAAWQSVLDSTP